MRGACQVADFTLMIRATRGRSRSINHWNGNWIVRRESKRLGLRWFPPSTAKMHGRFLEAFLERQFFVIVLDVGSILGNFWKPKWKRKSILGRLFFDVFFERVSLSILNRIL